MAENPKVNLALVNNLPDGELVQGTVYMSPDTSGNFIKVATSDSSVVTIFDGSIYTLKEDSPWVPGTGQGSAVLKSDIGADADASGNHSIAYGDSAVASGYSSFAGGDTVKATGNFSHAEGGATTAAGRGSHAEGYYTDASGNYSHAEGELSTTIGFGAHAEGYDTFSEGVYSHTEGNYTITVGLSSHAEGTDAIAIGNYSHAEGNHTAAYGNYSHAEGQISTVQSAFTITGLSGTTTYNTSQYNGLSVNTIISYKGTYARIISVGPYSFTLDKTLDASNNLSGVRIIIFKGGAIGPGSHIEGQNTSTIGNYSHAEGEGTVTRGYASHAEGSGTNADARYSHAEGIGTISSSEYSHAEGYSTRTIANYSHAEGYLATTSGISSHAEGYLTQTTNDYEHAEGEYNYSHTGTTLSVGIGTGMVRRNIVEVNNKKLYINNVGDYYGTETDSAKALDYVLNMVDLRDPEYEYIFNGGEIPAPSRPIVIPDNIKDYYIWLDNNESMMYEIAKENGYNSIQSYMEAFFNDPESVDSYTDRYEYYDEIEFDDSIYGLWYSSNADYYGILKQDSVQTMMDNSKEANLNNEYTPFIVMLNTDMEIEYTESEMGRLENIYEKALVAIKPIDLPDLSDIRAYYLYVSDYGDESGLLRYALAFGYYDIDDYLNNLLILPQAYMAESYFYDSDIEFDGSTYQLWLDYNNEQMPMLLKPDDTPEYMAMHSIEADYHNKYCPFVAMLSTDMQEVRYDSNNTDMDERYRLLCFRKK